MRNLFFFAISSALLLGFTFNGIGCKKIEGFPLWVGGKENIQISYTNNITPTVNVTGSTKFVSLSNCTAVDTGNGTIRISIDGVRVQSKRNNFEIGNIIVSEREDGGGWEKQSEFGVNTSAAKTDIAAVLVLDMSTSLGDLVNDLKKYAKKFAHAVVESTPNSKVGLVFFSDDALIQQTQFFDINTIAQADAAIDGYTNYTDRTALFEATIIGIDMLENLTFQGAKSLVVFTDGGDNDSDNPDLLKNEIAASTVDRFAIGLEGDDFDKGDLESLVDDDNDATVVKKEKDLEDVFDEITKLVVSVYQINYYRSSQILTSTIDILFEVEVDKIK